MATTVDAGAKREPYFTIYRLDRFEWEWTVYAPGDDGWSVRAEESGSRPSKFLARRRARRALRKIAAARKS